MKDTPQRGDGPKPETIGCRIPPHILQDSELTAARKIVLSRILQLTHTEGFCYASNGYLAEALGMSESQVSRQIGRLVSSGHLKRTMIRDSKGVVQQRRLYPSNPPQSRPESGSAHTPQEPDSGCDNEVYADALSRYARMRVVEKGEKSSKEVLEGNCELTSDDEQKTAQDGEVTLPQWANLDAGYTLECEACQESASNPKRRREACEEHYIPTHEREQVEDAA